jgi:hypothetical protein
VPVCPRRRRRTSGGRAPSGRCSLFGAYDQGGLHFLFSIPEIVFEVSITVFTLWNGFRPSQVFAATSGGRYHGAGEPTGHRVLVGAR